MRKIIRLIAVVLAGLSTSVISAQQVAAPKQEAPAPTQPAAAQPVIQIKDVPQLSLKFYGYVKLDAMYDTHRVQPGDLMFYVMPQQDGVDDDEFRMTARESRIGVDLAVAEVNGVKTSGKIEGDFYGAGGTDNASNFRLRLAYADVAMPCGTTIRAGQDWETFLTVIPKILNFSYLADAGALGLRRPQFRVSQDIKLSEKSKLFAKVAAARTIGQDIDGGGEDDGVDSGLPTMQYNVGIETPLWMEKAAKASISGHLGRETCDKTGTNSAVVANDDKDYDTWSVIGSLYLPIVKMVAIQGTIWQGENLDTYYGGIGQGINKTLETSIAAKGGFVQLLLDPTEKLSLSASYGLDDPDNGDLNAKDRSKNEIIFGNIFYKLTPAATVAFEYSNLTTSYKDADHAENHRFQGAMIYKF